MNGRDKVIKDNGKKNKNENVINEKQELKESKKYDVLLEQFQNGANILLSFLSFQMKLKNILGASSKKINLNVGKFYLISKECFSKYKQFYLFEELFKMINNYCDINDINNL